MDNPFESVVSMWLRAISLGNDVKQARFGKEAAEGMMFYTGPYTKFWENIGRDSHIQIRESGSLSDSGSTMRVTCNKVAEFVEIFGPAMYSRNPHRTVTPRKLPELPPELYATLPGPSGQFLMQNASGQEQLTKTRDQGRASLLEAYLNWSPGATDLRKHGRLATEEALIKGCGILLTEPYSPAHGGIKVVGSFQRTVDDLIIDPDATSWEDANWIALRCVHPVRSVENARGLAPGTLLNRGGYESNAQTASINAVSEIDGATYWNRRDGKSNDLLVYWKVWSKMGVGGRLPGVAPELRGILETFGNFCYLEVAAGVPFLLNAPDTLMPEEAVKRCHWPTPYWADGGWPITPIYFHTVPNSPWPLSHLSPAMGELKFLNWAYGHLATKIRTTCRDFIVIDKGAGAELKHQLLSGHDLSIIELSQTHGKTIDQVVQFLQHPSFNGDIWRVIEAISEQFDKRTGLTELMYGQTGSSYRSGTEAQVKSDQMNVRPDDMAEMVEASFSTAARREALCARWHLTPEDVSRPLGSTAAMWWQELVYTSDPKDIIFNFEYRVEAGSTRKPNKAAAVQQATAMMNNLFQPFFSYAGTTGDTGPINAMIEFWTKANDVPNPEAFLLKTAPQPMPATAPAAGAVTSDTGSLPTPQGAA